MPVYLALLPVAALLLLTSCGEDRFDQRYRDAEAQIRQEDKTLASEMPGDSPAGPGAVQPAAGPTPPP